MVYNKLDTVLIASNQMHLSRLYALETSITRNYDGIKPPLLQECRLQRIRRTQTMIGMQLPSCSVSAGCSVVNEV